jgi:hypothetical protein
MELSKEGMLEKCVGCGIYGVRVCCYATFLHLMGSASSFFFCFLVSPCTYGERRQKS